MESKINTSLQIPGIIRGMADEESRTVEFVISTETVDRHGTVFMADGWNLDQYRSNPIVAYQHQTSTGFFSDANPDTIIGTSEVRLEQGQLIARATFEPADINPLAEKIFRKIQAGTLRAASVGAIPEAGHWGSEERGEDPEVFYFTRQSLVEWSVVNIPSNPDALKRNYSEVIEKLKAAADPSTDVQPSNQRGTALFAAQLLINQNKAK